MFVSLQIHVLKANPQCDGIRRWELGSWLGHEGGSLMNWISALIRGIKERSLAPPTEWGHREKTFVYEVERGPEPDSESACVLILDFLASRTGRNKFLLLNATQAFCYSSLNVLRQ